MVVQAMAILEVLHAALGFVKGSVLATFMQVEDCPVQQSYRM